MHCARWPGITEPCTGGSTKIAHATTNLLENDFFLNCILSVNNELLNVDYT